MFLYNLSGFIPFSSILVNRETSCVTPLQKEYCRNPVCSQRHNHLPTTNSERPYNPGDIIIHEGDEVLYGFIFISGTVDVIKRDIQDRKYIVTKNHTGEFCSFMDIYSNHTIQCATIQAVTDVVGYKLKKSYCLDLLSKPSLFQEYLITTWATQFYLTNTNTTRYPMYSFKYKLIDFLLTQYNSSSLYKEIVITIKRDELASSLGSSRRTLFRLIKEFKEDNLISLEKDTIRISSSQQAKLVKIFEEWE
jgi:CRP-like cAMP-binding protein